MWTRLQFNVNWNYSKRWQYCRRNYKHSLAHINITNKLQNFRSESFYWIGRNRETIQTNVRTNTWFGYLQWVASQKQWKQFNLFTQIYIILYENHYIHTHRYILVCFCYGYNKKKKLLRERTTVIWYLSYPAIARAYFFNGTQNPHQTLAFATAIELDHF